MSRLSRLPAFFDQFNAFGREMDRVLERWARGAGGLGLSESFPLVNVWEAPDAYHVEAELPGVRQEDLDIQVSNRKQVTLSGERKADLPEGTWHRRERGTGKFSRALTFPAPIDAEKVEARLENGVLHLTLPKAEEARPRRIAVKAE
jgi:HSP20 family protein